MPIKPPRVPKQQQVQETKHLLESQPILDEEDKDKEDGELPEVGIIEKNEVNDQHHEQKLNGPTPGEKRDIEIGVSNMDKTITQEEEFS